MTHFIEPSKPSYKYKDGYRHPNPSVNLHQVMAVERQSDSEMQLPCIIFYGPNTIRWAYSSREERDADWQRILRG